MFKNNYFHLWGGSFFQGELFVHIHRKMTKRCLENVLKEILHQIHTVVSHA